MRKLFGLAISVLVAAASANTNAGSEMFYPLSKTCSEKTDCFGCTLNNCNWDGEKCTGTPSFVTVEMFSKNSAKCGDPLSVCRRRELPKDGCGDNCKEEHQNYDKIVLSYTPEAPNVKIPKGYFCSFKLQINKEFQAIMYWN